MIAQIISDDQQGIVRNSICSQLTVDPTFEPLSTVTPLAPKIVGLPEPPLPDNTFVEVPQGDSPEHNPKRDQTLQAAMFNLKSKNSIASLDRLPLDFVGLSKHHPVMSFLSQKSLKILIKKALVVVYSNGEALPTGREKIPRKPRKRKSAKDAEPEKWLFIVLYGSLRIRYDDQRHTL